MSKIKMECACDLAKLPILLVSEAGFECRHIASGCCVGEHVSVCQVLASDARGHYHSDSHNLFTSSQPVGSMC